MQSLKVFLCPSDERRHVHHRGRAGDGGPRELRRGVRHQRDRGQPRHGNGTFFRNSRVRFADVQDGTSKTYVVGERGSDIALATWTGAVPGARSRWAATRPREGRFLLVLGRGDHQPNSPSSHIDDFYSRHAGDELPLRDGSVHSIGNCVSPVWAAKIQTRNLGEVIAPEW